MADGNSISKPHRFQKTHGMTDSPEYRTWCLIKSRCLNQRFHKYRLYGGRGIKICDRWLHSFENFFADMGPRPSPKHSIDRLDTDGDYLPENCRWATAKEQARNRRHTLQFTHAGETLPLAEWADRYGVDYLLLRKRLLIYGWPFEKAVTAPAVAGRKLFVPETVRDIRCKHSNGTSQAALAREYEVSPGSIRQIVTGKSYGYLEEIKDSVH